MYRVHFCFPKTQGLEQSRGPVCLLQAGCPAPEAGCSAGEATFVENESAGQHYLLTCLQDARLQTPGDKRAGGLRWRKWHLHSCRLHFAASPGSGPNVRPKTSPLCSRRRLAPTQPRAACRVVSLGQVAVTSHLSQLRFHGITAASLEKKHTGMREQKFKQLA